MNYLLPEAIHLCSGWTGPLSSINQKLAVIQQNQVELETPAFLLCNIKSLLRSRVTKLVSFVLTTGH